MALLVGTKEKLIEPKTMNAGSVWDMALSSDPQQTFLYVADGENSLIHILRRETLEILTAFGEGGRQPGHQGGGGAPELEGPPSQTVREIDTANAWMVLWYIEQDPAYKALLDECLDEVERFVGDRHGGMQYRRGYIFISAPNATTPVSPGRAWAAR